MVGSLLSSDSTISPALLVLLRTIAKSIAAILVFCLAAQPAYAHLVGVEFGDFYAGALHIVSAPEHLAILFGVALLAAFHPREASRWILLGVLVGLAAGVVIAAFTPLEIPLESAVAITLILAGILGVVARPMPAAALVVIGGVIAMVHSFVNAASASTVDVDWLLYGGGIVAAGTALIILFIAAVATLAEAVSWMRVAARALSSWISAIGFLYLAVSLIA